MQRIILHMDLDSFYASVEEIRNPGIQGKPIVICVFSGRSTDSGAVATANYRARELGIRAGMPISLAKRMATSDSVFLPNDREYYSDVSDRIMDMLEEDCDVLEQASIDEAYLDVTNKSRGSWENARAIAQKIKNRIKEQEGLTCSVGIGPNKLVAKMAGKVHKPDGLTLIRENEVASFMENLEVDKIHGVGGKTVEILHSLGIRTAHDLADFSTVGLEESLGKNKAWLLKLKARGIDDSPVEQKEAQQISKMGTLKEDTRDIEKIFQKIQELSHTLKRKIEKKGVSFRTVSIILIDNNLGMQTRSSTLEQMQTLEQTKSMDLALTEARNLLKKFLEENPLIIRRVGIRVSNLLYKKKQRSLGDFFKS